MDRATEGRQTRNAERTRRAVLDAAVQVILDKGAAVTLAQVAAAAGVSKSGLIHHFGS
ncbi:helix-turn-helix transcriptional regulator, partial [Streptomyces sp. SID7982]|nr:helix-turn-helix transcriptional regulator [Streptomyces sp. SID7982]